MKKRYRLIKAKLSDGEAYFECKAWFIYLVEDGRLKAYKTCFEN